MEHYWKQDYKAAAAALKICEVEGEGVVSERVAQRRFQRFNNGEENTKDLPRSGRPKVWNIEDTSRALEEDPQKSTRRLSEELAIEASATLHADKKTAMTSGPSTSITIPNIEIDAISLVPCSIPSTAESTSSLQQASLPVTSSFTTVAKLDVGFYAIQEKISDEYFKVQILKTPWNPPRDYKFPISTKRNLRFQLKWMERFPWLSYSEYKSGAYCRVCVVMGRSLDEGKGGHQRIGQLVTEPFCKWKNALEIFEAHAKSGYHKRNSELADNFLKVMSSQASSVIQQLSSERKRQQEENRKKLIPIRIKIGDRMSRREVQEMNIFYCNAKLCNAQSPNGGENIKHTHYVHKLKIISLR
ncbi:hypothetical protein C0J52_28034 [Blattella germanica]|nr:hypothetical protein C0J52_28034 [Blattella germanica]